MLKVKIVTEFINTKREKILIEVSLLLHLDHKWKLLYNLYYVLECILTTMYINTLDYKM
jgi:hypothetical protein